MLLSVVDAASFRFRFSYIDFFFRRHVATPRFCRLCCRRHFALRHISPLFSLPLLNIFAADADFSLIFAAFLLFRRFSPLLHYYFMFYVIFSLRSYVFRFFFHTLSCDDVITPRYYAVSLILHIDAITRYAAYFCLLLFFAAAAFFAAATRLLTMLCHAHAIHIRVEPYVSDAIYCCRFIDAADITYADADFDYACCFFAFVFFFACHVTITLFRCHYAVDFH